MEGRVGEIGQLLKGRGGAGGWGDSYRERQKGQGSQLKALTATLILRC